mmetsp:Transcript_1817/g.2712  ORF Transcript_1817/g.2712 Transcript_1817/m.2712 type:complete len:113 (-) Transcript_1817:235-573(-)
MVQRTIVKPGSFLDGIVWGMMSLVLMGLVMFSMGHLYTMVMDNKLKALSGLKGVFQMMAPMKGDKWEFNISHTMLFGILACLVSMVQPQPPKPDEEESERKAKKSKKKSKGD